MGVHLQKHGISKLTMCEKQCTCIQVFTCKQTNSRACMHTNANSRKHAHAHTHARTHTHTQTHSLSLQAVNGVYIRVVLGFNEFLLNYVLSTIVFTVLKKSFNL